MLTDKEALLHELVLKNVYILTTNISGLEVGGNVGRLWAEHNAVAYDVASDVITLQEALIGQRLNRHELINGMVKAFDGDREHICMGRSAVARLQRALSLAAEKGLSLKVLEKIANTIQAEKQ